MYYKCLVMYVASLSAAAERILVGNMTGFE